MVSAVSDFCRESRNQESNSRSSTRVFRCSRILAHVDVFSTGSPPLCISSFAEGRRMVSALLRGGKGLRLTGRARPRRILVRFGGFAHHVQDQTHVSAQQPPPKQDPWVFGPDENQIGPCRSGPPPGERAQAHLRLSGGVTGPRRLHRGFRPVPCTHGSAPRPLSRGGRPSRGRAASGPAGIFARPTKMARNSTAALWSFSRAAGPRADSGSASRPPASRAAPSYAIASGAACARSFADGGQPRPTARWTSS